MDHEDPITQFFPDEESVDLYAVLSLTESAKQDDIKKAYRRLALQYHPDKHATANESAKSDASTRFQQIGFAYAVLSDEKRKQRYDKTGKTDEGFDLAAGEDGWEAYFEDLFDRVTRGKLDEMKKEYQGSSEEVEDLKAAYNDTEGSIGDIMTMVPHSTHEDEARFIVIISDLISKGELKSLPGWETTIKDEKARLVRKKQGEKEAKEAEALAKELGVWDEFYGSGKSGQRKSKGKGKASSKDNPDEEDVSALQALILKKKEKNMDSFFDGLAAKYAEPTSKSRGKKRGKPTDDDDELPSKRSRKAAPPDIDDAEFEKLQQKLFSDKAKSSGGTASKGKGKKAKTK
ncbi:DnaJ-domain-containing protein [Dendrothele bispora CBS 962.96]|uniref:DnaJ-domain-containing protein n=1 Tax=Dendrothele bispora (strain CBS 962.96) TaxID=1314807 RepID=A0A4S8LPR1_DENBC|nr:DnaJ-domain-containing protein [Dendrothele bispora CBS 962.96]THU91171.1 DnaJ-domain-containing protein [Dendrothele bispora CBS 962.96]